MTRQSLWVILCRLLEKGRRGRKNIRKDEVGVGGGGASGWQKLQDTFASLNHPHQYMYSMVA